MNEEELTITKEDLVNWLDRPPSNDDLDLCEHLSNAVQNQEKYFEKIKQLQNNWNELKKWLEEEKDYLTEIDGQRIPLNDSFEFCSMNELYQTGKYSGFMEAFEKMQELQGDDKN